MSAKSAVPLEWSQAVASRTAALETKTAYCTSIFEETRDVLSAVVALRNAAGFGTERRAEVQRNEPRTSASVKELIPKAP